MTRTSSAKRRIQRHIENLTTGDKDVSNRAERYLIRWYGARALEPLIEVSTHPSPMARYRAAWVLGHTKDPRAFETLLRMTDDPDEGVRYDATVALGILGDPRAIGPLARMLLMNDHTRPAGYAISKMGLQSVPALELLLANPDAGVRHTVVSIIGGFAETFADERCIEMLRSSLSDSNDSVREDAQFWLNEAGRAEGKAEQ